MMFCHYCNKNDEQTPLFPYQFQGKTLYVCVVCYHKYFDVDEKEEGAK